MKSLIGQTLAGRYTVDAHIGRGGMADVYKGTDIVLERPIAIKVLTDREPTVLRKFLREAQSIAKLNHPNIVAVYDAGECNDVSYIIMEYLAGRTLAQIPAHELTIHTALRYFIEVLGALEHAHAHGLIHRDIKPANVMVTSAGTVKVMDFGMSRRTTEMSNEANAGEIVGTIAYLAPERFLGKIADQRSDLYSVGVMMYEVFTGRVPFESAEGDLVAVIFAHVNEKPPSLRSRNRQIPAQIDKIVLQLLEKEPDARIASAHELAAQLEALIGPPLGPSEPRSQTTQAGKVVQPPTGQPTRARGLDRPATKATTLNIGYSNTLAGMLAARKRDYPEAIRTFTLAMQAFSEIGNDVEHAKAASKYGAMILQKNLESDGPDRREVDETIKVLGASALALQGLRHYRELEETQSVLHSLQRLGTRLR